MYFPHAFEKVFLATAGIVTAPAANANTLSLTAAQLAVVDARTNLLITLGNPGNYQATPLVYLAQGSLHKIGTGNGGDRLGQFHGGYNESVKSKGINPKYISRFYVVAPQNETVAKVKVTIVGTAAELAEQEVYRLRLDVKGTSILRVFGHQYYKTFDATTLCADAAQLTPTFIAQQWADAINADQQTSLLVKASVVNGELVIEDILVETEFDGASYSRTDFVNHEKNRILTSVWDDRNEPCVSELFTHAVITEPKQATGYSGDTVLKEFTLSQRYIQEPFQDDLRLREILQDKTFGAVDRSQSYVVYHICHSIPKTSNGNSHLESDQYLLKVVVNARNTAFETYISSLIESAGNGVNLEVY